MFYTSDSKTYLFNLIDTPGQFFHSLKNECLHVIPGHVDFTWEVSRSLAACQGALLLVDASQGIQAQTISVYHISQERNLKIIPILNKVGKFFWSIRQEFSFLTKVDLPAADVDRVTSQMENVFGISSEDVLLVSAKTGEGVSDVLRAIAERIPPPEESRQGPFRALLFDSSYVYHAMYLSH